MRCCLAEVCMVQADSRIQCRGEGGGGGHTTRLAGRVVVVVSFSASRRLPSPPPAPFVLPFAPRPSPLAPSLFSRAKRENNCVVWRLGSRSILRSVTAVVGYEQAFHLACILDEQRRRADGQTGRTCVALVLCYAHNNRLM